MAAVTLQLLGENGQLLGVINTTDKAVRKFSGSVDGMDKSSRRAAKSLDNTSSSASRLNGNLKDLAKGFLGGLGIYGFTQLLSTAVDRSVEFGAAMTEVSTLLTDTSGIDAQKRAVREMAIAYGQSATVTAKALYQIISAGGEGEDAMRTLDVANKLAVGGITDVATAADGLTSVMNAYKGSAGSAADISDALFVGMRAGKTTIGELSGSIGLIANLANTMGVSFDELVASISAVTTGGINTKVAVTSLRAALSAVVKPSSEAAKLAEQLGIEFNSQAIQAKGLAGFLQDVTEKTDGSQDAMAVLFGGVEALTSVLALTGGQADAFSDTLDKMTTKTGESDAAFKKMAETGKVQFNRLKAAANDALITLGDKLLIALTPLAKFLADNMNAVVDAVVLLTKVTAAYVVVFKVVPGIVHQAAIAYEHAAVAAWRFAAGQGAGNLGIKASIKNIGILKAAGGSLVALFTGYEIGTYLRENFQVARVAATAFAATTLKGWEEIKTATGIVWEFTKFAATSAFNAIKVGLAELIGLYASVGEAGDILGLGAGITGKLRELEQSLRPATDATKEYKAAVKELTAAGKEEIERIDDWAITSIRDEISGRTAATEAATKQAAAAKEAAAALKDAASAASAAEFAAAVDELTSSLSSQIAKLKQHKIELTKGAEAALLFSAMNALGVKSVDKLGSGIRNQIKTLVALQKEIDETAEAKENEIASEERALEAMIQTNTARAEFLTQMETLAAQMEGPLASANLVYEQSLENISDMYFEGIISAEQAAKAAALYGKSWKKAAKDIEDGTDEARELESILSSFDNIGLGGLVRDIQLVEKALEEASSQEIIDQDEIDKLGGALDGLKNRMGVQMVGAALTFVDAMKSMATEGTKSYKALEIASLALNLVLGIAAILNQGKGEPYSAFFRMAAMAAVVAQFVSGIGSVTGGGGGPSSQSAEARQEQQGTGSVLGDFEAQSESIANSVEITADATKQLVGINQGMLRALQAMQAGITGASTQLAQGAGSITAPTLSGGSGGFSDPLSIFGGSQSLIDQGVRIMSGTLSSLIENIMATTYQTIETDGGWFHSDSTSVQTQALSSAVTTQLQLVLSSMADAVREGADALGLNMDEVNAAIDAYRVQAINISTLDLNGEDATAALAAVFSEIFDGLAGSIVPFIDQFQRLGEGLGETLIRVATEVQVVQEAVMRLGLDIGGALGPEAMAQVSDALVTAAGGVDEFISGMDTFLNAFATDEFKLSVLQSDLTRALEQVGLAVPETSRGMWELLQSLDGTTAAGQEQIATLFRLAGAAEEYYNRLEEGQQSIRTRQTAEDIIAAIDTALAASGSLLAKRFADGIGRDDTGGGGPRGPGGPFDPTVPVDPTVPRGPKPEPVFDPIAEIMGEASTIAEQWRGSADDLLDGAQFLLAAVTDMQHGLSLLGVGPGSLTAVTELVQELALEDESLIETYRRLVQQTELTSDVFQIMGRAFIGTREEFVRFADDLAIASGGVGEAGRLINNYFQNFYSDVERAVVSFNNLRERAAGEFSDVGLSVGDFTGSSGMADFRVAFEEAMSTLSGDALAQWLQAADVLAELTQAQQDLNGMQALGVTSLEELSERLQQVSGFLAAGAAAADQLSTFGMEPLEEQLYRIDLAFQAALETATALGQSEEDLNAIRQASEDQIALIMAQEAARAEAQLNADYRRAADERRAELIRQRDELDRMRETLDKLLNGLVEEATLRDLSTYQKQVFAINKRFSELTETAAGLYASTAQLNYIESQRLANLQALASAEIGDVLDPLRSTSAARGLSEVEVQMLELNTQFDDYMQRLIEAGATQAELAELEQYRQEQIADLQTQSYEDQLAWLEQLRQYRDSLLLNDQLTTLTPAEQFAEAQSQYLATLAAAQSGDVGAQEQFQQIAQAYLEQARAFFGDSQGYTDIFSSVVDAINGFLGGGLGSPEDQVATILDSIANLPGSQAGGSTADGSSSTVTAMQDLKEINQAGFGNVVDQLRDANDKLDSMRSTSNDQLSELRAIRADQPRA